VVDGRVRTDLDVPDDPDLAPSPDRQSAARADLHERLERIADGHPSSTGYATEDQLSRDRDPDSTADIAAPDRVDTSGWQAPGVRDRSDLPDLDDVKLTDDRASHILDGDGPGTPGGGHRHGTGRPGKTEFPADWSDDKIVSAVQDVARNPGEAHWQDFNGRWRVTGDREDVRLTAVVLPDGRIWAAWPEAGRGGVTQNPRT
jgi:hypothetical protein